MADYLRLFLSDPRICPVNPHVWKIILNRFIIPKRAPASAAKYASIWTDAGSPLDVCMASLAQKLEKAFMEDRIVCVRYASSYSSPFMEDALGECMQMDCDAVAVIPLYPQSAYSTTNVVRDQVRETLGRLGWTPDLLFVNDYCDSDEYIAAIAKSVEASGFNVAEGDRLLFAFHSIPVADIRAGDTYGDQTQRTARNIAKALGLKEECWRVGYQCRFDRSRQWLTPFTAAVLRELADAKRLFVVAPNFSIDCLETLYDIQQVLREKWIAVNGGDIISLEPDNFYYVSCLNDSDSHVELLRNVALQAIER